MSGAGPVQSPTGPAAYLEFWRAHPAVGPLVAADEGGLVESYLLHDLTPADDGSGEWISNSVLAATRDQGRAAA